MVTLNENNLIEITENGDFYLLTTTGKLWLSFDHNIMVYGFGMFKDKNHIPAPRPAFDHETEISKDGIVHYVVWRNGDIKRTITDRINDRDEIKRPKHQTKNSKPV